MTTPPSSDKGIAGLGIDAYGGQTVDPTENVKALVIAEARRLDEKIDIEGKTIREILLLREDHFKEMRKAEANRIDAIRQVDVGAVAAAAAVQATQATTLASQVATSADALRNQVAAAASAQTTALAAALDPIQKDIADLRRAQYEAQGQKAQVVEAHADTANVGMIVGIVGGFAAILFAIVALYIGTHNKTTPAAPVVVTVPTATK